MQETQETNPRVTTLVDKINSLNSVFAQAETVCANEIVDFIDEKTQQVSLYTEDITPTEVIKLELMVDDFKYTRETLKETVANGRKVLNVITLELLDSDEEGRASLITSFAELVSSVNQSVKLLSASYKDIANVLESIEKIRKSKLATPEPKQTGNVYIDKMVVHSEQVSTLDIIARLREKQESKVIENV